MAFGCQEKNNPKDRKFGNYAEHSVLKIMNKSSVFESDFLTNDSLVPAFVFCRESQSLTRLHQTSIGID